MLSYEASNDPHFILIKLSVDDSAACALIILLNLFTS